MQSAGPSVQVFGRDDSRETRRCLRFFKERRMTISYVDVARRPMAQGELRRFTQRFGATALLDESSKAYRDAGMAWLRIGDEELVERLLTEPRLLRLPLARFGSELSVGVDETTWRAWHRRAIDDSGRDPRSGAQ
jgi:arsenate reductase-like glutaredoxin family protein